jgi:hypothetical protein
MATKTRKQSYRRAGRSGGRITGGRATRGRGRGGSAKPGGPMGLLNQLTSQIGRTGGRGAKKGGGLASKATNFVGGFLSGGGKSGRRRR